MPPSYGTDIDLVERLLLEIADGTADVLKDPPPGLRLMEFGDSGLGFELRVWSTTLIHRKGVLRNMASKSPTPGAMSGFCRTEKQSNQYQIKRGIHEKHP